MTNRPAHQELQARGTQREAPTRDNPTIRDRLVSTVLWGAGVGWLVPTTSAMTVLHHLVGAKRIEPVSRLYCRVQTALTGSRWRAVVHPDVCPDTPYIFAQNHTNHFDHVAMYNATPHFKQGLELESHFRYPFYGWFMKSRGTIPVPSNKEQRTRQIFAAMRRELSQGTSILAFPEGTRTLDGKLGPFRKGIFHIAHRLKVSIAPTTVTGMYDMMHKGSLVIRPGNTLTVYIDKPVDMSNVHKDDIPKVMEDVHRTMSRRLEEHRQQKLKREHPR